MTLLLLHGAIGSSAQLKPLADILKSKYDVRLFDFPGHGGRDLTDRFSIEMFGSDLVKWIEDNSPGKVDVFGYSMGGYVALQISRHFPEKINRIFTLATKFAWTVESSVREAGMLNPSTIKEKLPDFANTLEKIHHPQDWETILKLTAEMLISLGQNPTLSDDDFKLIGNEVLLSVGENDKMVGIAETENVAKQLPNGRLLILPNTKHPIEGVDLNILANQITGFFI